MKENIAVLIPCLNEEATIAGVVKDFARVLPSATIYVFDNTSTDKTIDVALGVGAVVHEVKMRGKGNVVREMFRQVHADAYVLVDGDSTYPADMVHELLRPVLDGEVHMTVGDRISSSAYAQQNSRPFHSTGNRLITCLINLFFGARCRDVLSGYRVCSQTFVETIPIMSEGFEIETELTLHCLDKNISFREVPIHYRERPEGSSSKLRTVRDGLLILRTISMLFKDYRPLLFFTLLSAIFAASSLAAGTPVILEYLRVTYITHVPLAILAAGLGLISALLFCCGLILDTTTRQYRALLELRISDVLRNRSHEAH